MKTIHAITPLFIVADLAASVAFYRDCLGFELRMSAPESAPFFAIVGRDEVGIMLKEVAPDVGPLPNCKRHEWAKWDAFVSTPYPEALARECQKRGVTFDVEDTEDGLRGFEATDADGYVLFFGHPQQARSTG